MGANADRNWQVRPYTGFGAAQVGELLRRGEKMPGFGHFVYRSGDPRAVVLLGLVRRAAPKSGNSRSPRPCSPKSAKVAARAEHRLRRRDPGPGGGHGSRAGEVVFAVARTAGWIAHALEAYAAAVRYVPALSTPARLRSSTHDAVAICYRFVT